MQANFDELTGLPNRAYFFEGLRHAIGYATEQQNKFAVLFVDLDRFKYVNDTFGHSAGDELLKVISVRMKSAVKESDLVARLGGDEFVVLLRDIRHKSDARGVVKRLLASLEQPVSLNSTQELVVSASIGITFFPENGNSIESLMSNSDTAMYKAKENGRNTFSFFSEDMQQAVVQQLELEQDLRRAVANQYFQLHYQPIFSLESKTIIGAEALIRWTHPQKGLIAPDNFIPVAEELMLIDAIGEWVLDTALRDIKQWHEAGYPLNVSVNVSAKQTHVGKRVKQALLAHDVAPCHLKIEITESMLIEHSHRIMDEIATLRDIGVGIHLDDFGTGYSSLNYLRQIPADVIKIDRSFLNDCNAENGTFGLVEAVVTIAQKMQLKIIAEGIETKQQLSYLNGLGCNFGQGYLISKPLPQDAFVQLLARSYPMCA